MSDRYESLLQSLNDWAGRNKSGFYDEAQDDVIEIIANLSRGPDMTERGT